MSSSIITNNGDSELLARYPWMDKVLFEKVIEKDYPRQEFAVEQISLEPALQKGENYFSEMIRAKVDYVPKERLKTRINFVIKAPECLLQNDLFVREIAVFNNVIPHAEALLREIDDDTKFSAKCYEANSEKSFLVFEDLTVSGYRNVDRRIGLSVDHFKAVFTKLAKWHAVTAILNQKNPDLMAPFKTAFATEYFETLVKSVIKATARFTETIPSYRELTRKLEHFSEGTYEKIRKSMERHSGDFNCLCHIDLWTNNVMFNESLPIANNSLLIDFQMAYLGSPVLDLCYSLYSSSDVSMGAKDFDDLISFYHQELTLMLKKLSYAGEIPTLESLHEQLLLRGTYGVPLGLFGTVNRYLENTDEDLFASESEDGIQFRLNLFSNPKCREKLLFLLSYFESRGYFDA